MIGQKKLYLDIKEMIDHEVFPQFNIFLGGRGCGKRTLMEEIARLMTGYQIHRLDDVKVDTIRDMISEAMSKTGSGAKIVYIIPNAEDMSVQAKNSLLKITEEPPKGAWFLMSANSEEDILATIKNRAAIYHMRPYSRAEKLEYIDSIVASPDDEELKLILKVSNNLSDIDKLLKMSPTKLQSYVEKLIDSLATSTPSKLLASIKDIAFKEESDGYELDLFWRMFIYTCGSKALESTGKNSRMYADLIRKTCERSAETRFSAVSKEHTFDMWLLDCRKIVKSYGNK